MTMSSIIESNWLVFRLNNRLLEMRPDLRDNIPHFRIVDGSIENMPIELNSNGNASTSTAAVASTSGSRTAPDEASGMERVFDISQKIQRLESVTSEEVSTNNSDTLPVDSDLGGQSDSTSEPGYQELLYRKQLFYSSKPFRNLTNNSFLSAFK